MARTQVQHTIGQKQTEKCQITDVRMAKIAKDAQRQAMPGLRKAQRDLAARAGMAPLLVSKHAQALFLCLQMHGALELDAAENNGVIKGARSAGMLRWLPTSTGLRRADGPEWRELTSGSSRIPEPAWAQRESHVLAHGQPQPPDWSRLLTLQQRLADEAQQRQAAALPPAARKAALADKPELDAPTGFKDLDPAGYGEPVISEEQTRELCPCFEGVTVADLHGSAGLLALMHPRVRR